MARGQRLERCRACTSRVAKDDLAFCEGPPIGENSLLWVGGIKHFFENSPSAFLEFCVEEKLWTSRKTPRLPPERQAEMDAAPTCANRPDASALGAAEWAAMAGGASTAAYAPFVTILSTQSDRVIKLARVTSRDVVCDLGFGDAQFLLHVAETTGCRCIGCEVNGDLVSQAAGKVAAAGEVGSRVELSQALIDTYVESAAFRDATIIFLHLVPSMIQELEPVCVHTAVPCTCTVRAFVRVRACVCVRVHVAHSSKALRWAVRSSGPASNPIYPPEAATLRAQVLRRALERPGVRVVSQRFAVLGRLEVR